MSGWTVPAAGTVKVARRHAERADRSSRRSARRSPTPSPSRDGTTTKMSTLAVGMHPVINEVDYDQPGTDTAEFVELYNPFATPVDLTGLALVFATGTNADYMRVPLSGSLAAGAYLVIGVGGTIALPAAIQNGSATNPTGGRDHRHRRAHGGRLGLVHRRRAACVSQITGFPATTQFAEGTWKSLVDSTGTPRRRFRARWCASPTARTPTTRRPIGCSRARPAPAPPTSSPQISEPNPAPTADFPVAARPTVETREPRTWHGHRNCAGPCAPSLPSSSLCLALSRTRPTPTRAAASRRPTRGAGGAGRRAHRVRHGRRPVTAHIQIQYQGTATDFGWLLPLPSVPTLELGTDELFTQLTRHDAAASTSSTASTTATARSIPSRFGGGGGASTGRRRRPRRGGGDDSSGSARWSIQDSIGPYDYAVLKADTRTRCCSGCPTITTSSPPAPTTRSARTSTPARYFLALKLKSGQLGRRPAAGGRAVRDPTCR